MSDSEGGFVNGFAQIVTLVSALAHIGVAPLEMVFFNQP